MLCAPLHASCLRRLLVVGVLILIAPQSRAGLIVKVDQVGADVVFSGSGSVDVTGLTFGGSTIFTNYGGVQSAGPFFNMGMKASTFSTVSGVTSNPANFGTHTALPIHANTGSGNVIGAKGNTLYLPAGYTSGTSLSSSSVYKNATYATLGLTPGTYVWSWGSDSMTLQINEAAAVPEPGSFALGLALAGGLTVLRRRRKPL